VGSGAQGVPVARAQDENNKKRDTPSSLLSFSPPKTPTPDLDAEMDDDSGPLPFDEIRLRKRTQNSHNSHNPDFTQETDHAPRTQNVPQSAHIMDDDDEGDIVAD